MYYTIALQLQRVFSAVNDGINLFFCKHIIQEYWKQ